MPAPAPTPRPSSLAATRPSPALARARAVAPFAAALLALASARCRSTPSEPAASAREAPAAAAARADAAPPRYRPALAESARRIAASVADGGVAPRADEVTRLDLPAPPTVDVVAARFGTRWVVAAVEADRVTLGLDGAERIFNLLNAAGRPPHAVDLARIIGALHYYPWRVYDGANWSRTPLDTPAAEFGSTPSLVERPGGTGRSLTFSYFIPRGQPGEGLHLGHFRVTDSGLLIDEAPNPGVR